MARIKINFRKMDPKRMEGRQIVLQVERVDVEKGEILCTVIAMSPDIKDDAIPITPISAEWGPVKPYYEPQPDPYEDLRKMLDALNSTNGTIFYTSGS